ncbi:MAG TPA: hypothetical protein VGR62_11280 [Candidatus Binatia bacterium]|nr:hypothetical protein [Candidatus Binatia bacterium]
MKRVLGVTIGMALAVIACGGGGDDKAAAPAAAPESVTGVAECDSYLVKAEACTAKVPEASRPIMEKALKDQRDGFKQLAANPQAKDTLATSCKQLSDGLEKNPLCK